MLYALMLAERICKTSNRREVISHINRTTDILLALIELHCKIEYQLNNNSSKNTGDKMMNLYDYST